MEIFALALEQESFINSLRTLAIEWRAKTITSDRFSERVYAMLYEHSAVMKKLADDEANPSQSTDKHKATG